MNNLADIKSAGGVALRVRTQGRVEERQEAEEAPGFRWVCAGDAERPIAPAGVRLHQRFDRFSLGGVGLAQVEDHLRRALGDGEAGALRLDVRLRAFRHRIERPERAHGVGIELQPHGFGGEDGEIDRVGRIAARRERGRAVSK